MIVLAAALMLVAADSGDTPLADFNNCLKAAHSSARARKTPVESFEATLRSACANVEDEFRASIVRLDIQHGMSRKEASADADWTVGDYYAERLENYKSEMGAMPGSEKTADRSSASSAAVAPPPTPSSAPADPK